MASDPAATRLLARALAGPDPLAEGRWRGVPGDREAPRGTLDAAGCYRYRPEPGAPPDCAAADVVERWEDGLRSGEHRGWLLAPVAGALALARGAVEHAEGLSALGDALTVCVDRAVPDWGERLRHPALAVCAADRRADVRAGDAGESAREIAAGTIDVVLAYGPVAAELRAAVAPHRALRVRPWDRTYGLWLAPAARWVNDPLLRRWMATVLDRRAMAELLFAGQASEAWSFEGERGAPAWEPRASRPLGRATRPALELARDPDDPLAERLASRIRAVLEAHDVRVSLVPVGGSDPERPPALRLVVRRPTPADPVLGLLDALASVGEGGAGARLRLERASRLPRPEQRRAAAAAVERALLADARLVPLVRVHAWLVPAPGLRLRVNAAGDLRVRASR